jgi:hypothetical protein
MTVKIKVIDNKNQNMKHKDNNLQIPITLFKLFLFLIILSNIIKDSMISILISVGLGA